MCLSRRLYAFASKEIKQLLNSSTKRLTTRKLGNLPRAQNTTLLNIYIKIRALIENIVGQAWPKYSTARVYVNSATKISYAKTQASLTRIFDFLARTVEKKYASHLLLLFRFPMYWRRRRVQNLWQLSVYRLSFLAKVENFKPISIYSYQSFHIFFADSEVKYVSIF